MRATGHPARKESPRLNLGYVSVPGEEGLSVRLLERILAGHDRQRFSVFCYATSGLQDAIQHRLARVADHWRDLTGVNDFDASDRIRADSIDLLVDLAGHCAGGRLKLFARRPAPTQVSWLGYPDTSGLDAIDFRLTDAVADPVGASERFASEKLHRLREGWLCYVAPADCPEVAPAPCASAGHVTFGCCADLAAVTPGMLELWAEILRSVPSARLVVRAAGLGAATARRRLLERLQAGGVAAARVDLLREDGADARLPGYAAIDISLDTSPRNGVEATCESLWMGAPVVSLAGRTHASRIGASILHGAGLDELVAATTREYVAIAVGLASRTGELAALRAGLRARLRASALLDAARFTRSLEEAYVQMHRRSEAAHAPEAA
jgi:protein O-GlcNAc transferase